MSTSDLTKQFSDIVRDRPPVATGVLPVSEDSCSLFYKHGTDARFVNLSAATPNDLGELSAACETATFGRGNEHVHDETYRKAGKLDREHFSCKLDEQLPKILDAIRPVLFTGGEEKTNIRTELYKLNVYGEGAFFKPHKDTPRSKTMFGSLVIAYPTPHVGGVLRFTKDDKSWSLDSGADLTAQQEPSIAYAVFFSDTDHEVLPVTSGHRVTVTYNLYLASATGEESVDSTAVSQMAENEVALATILESLLAKDDFLPRGGLMGFGLQYQYAVVAHGEVQDILERLKGVDAAVLSACRQLQLGVQIKAVGKTGSHEWLVDEVPRMDSSYYDGEGPSDTLAHGLLIKSYDSDATMSDMFTWVTSLTKNARSATQTFGTYGNEPSADEFYADLCLVVQVGKPGSRQDLAKLPSFRRNEDEWCYEMVFD